MFDHHHDEDDVFCISDAIQSLGELEDNTSQAILSQRASERIKVKTKVVVRPGNASDRYRFSIEGLTGDISNGGCQILLARPILPGDIYWLSFADTHVTLGSLLARCTRCRMVQEDAFESGFRFFHDIDLASALKDRDHQLA